MTVAQRTQRLLPPGWPQVRMDVSCTAQSALPQAGYGKRPPGEVGLDFEAASVNVEGSGWKGAAKAALDHRCASRPRVTTGRDGEMVSAKQRDATG